jgi:AAA domain
MKFIIIFGPSAVGKMSVGQALADIMDMKLYHNHMSIEAVRPIFDFGTPQFNRLVTLFRLETMREVAKSDDMTGLIFTFVWALDIPKEHEYVDRIVEIFENEGIDVFYIELEANLKTRLDRNKHEKRLLEKPSKRDVENSERVLYHEEKYQLNSKEGEFMRSNHLKINNENLSPFEVAQKIVTHFGWKKTTDGT